MGSTYYSKRLFIALNGVYQRAPRIRAKSYATKEAADAYAALKGIKNYSVEQKGKKFIILQKK